MTTKELTNEQKQQSLNMLGWFCAFAGVIGGILQAFFGQFAIFSEMIICFVDRKYVKEYTNKSIPWGYCLITPLYLYQRATQLKENKTKFIISLIIFIIGTLATLLSIAAMQ
ncbi:MAG: hypothetical protein IJL21_00550 [Alphaproteobacteria bacterium]|nr:hypothetical protein [Alphaproteobacteria bacterium]